MASSRPEGHQARPLASPGNRALDSPAREEHTSAGGRPPAPPADPVRPLLEARGQVRLPMQTLPSWTLNVRVEGEVINKQPHTKKFQLETVIRALKGKNKDYKERL